MRGLAQRAASAGKVWAVVWVLPLLLLVSVGCRKKKAPAPAPSSAPMAMCVAGRSVDPPRAETREAAEAAKDANHKRAAELLDKLLTKYPESASLRVWRGDAALFDDEGERYLTAADLALKYYGEARSLDERGCKLRHAERYYLHMGVAYALLRKDQFQPAIAELDKITAGWPDSAEGYYHRARAYCALGQLEPCARDFEHALVIAKSAVRPRFLRVHHSLDDWLRRAETQSEFPILRKSPEYKAIITRVTKASG